MNPAATFPIPAIMPAPLREPFVHKRLVFQSLLCSWPSMALLGMGRPAQASMWVVGCVLLMMLWHLNQKNRLALFTVLVGCVPALIILRGQVFPYNTPMALYGLAMLFAITDKTLFSRIWNTELTRYFVLFVTVYWLICAMYNLDYSSNLKSMDLVLSSMSLFLLSTRRSYLQTAMLGIALTEIALGLGMLPQSQRLGMIEVTGEETGGSTHIGNPILVGLPSAMMILWGICGKGQWLGLRGNPILRYTIMVAGGALLFLSTSRGAMFAGLAALTIVFFLDRGSRKDFAMAFILGFVLLSYGVTTEKGEYALRYITKLTDENKTLAQRTTGRLEQWVAIPAVFVDSPIWGHGPGQGRQISQKYCGRLLAWHNLYLHFIAETGLLGLVPVLVFLGAVFRKTVSYWRVHGDPMPLAAIMGFLVTGMSVNCLDMTCGLWLGVAMTAIKPVGYFVPRVYEVREQPPVAPRSLEEAEA